jgi:hypothetical protein
LEMAKHLQQQHPDVVRIARKWGRWQHVVDYKPFAHNRLIRKSDAVVRQGVNEYGLKLNGSIPGYHD